LRAWAGAANASAAHTLSATAARCARRRRNAAGEVIEVAEFGERRGDEMSETIGM
jgi:S-ribosylhomocysteine lyase LuxS involved in autoinducer biosynthesis